jgi:hypothetical protein
VEAAHTMLGAQSNAARDETWEFFLLFFLAALLRRGVVGANGGWGL